MGFQKNTIYQHKNQRDTVFEIVDFLGNNKVLMKIYNYNLAKISQHPLRDCVLGIVELTIGPSKDYTVIVEG